MQKVVWMFAFLFVCLSFCCSKGKTSVPVKQATVTDTSFFKGADVSWVTQMEASGYKFYDKNGNQQDLFALLKSLGFNSIRLRAWVNPTDGWCNTADLVKKAIRAKNAGMKILVDFHYSDVWADPGHQTKPVAWTNLTTANLITTLGIYTTGVMDTLKLNGITPNWVQIGNETNDGMMWQDGRISVGSTNALQFTYMVNTGYNAVKSVFPNAKVIVHIANGYDNADFEYIFDILKADGAKYDVIGMSLYPTTSNWSTYNTECLANMNDMVSRYGKQVMICEAGMSEASASTCESFLSDLITKVKSVSGGNGLGVYYWEPEAYNNWQG